MDIKISNKTIDDLIIYISKKFLISKIQEDNLTYKRKKQLFKNNIMHSLKNQAYGYSVNELDISMYKIEVPSNEDRLYYQPKNSNDIFDYTINPIYVLFESKTREIETNSMALLEELVLELGVNEFEFKNDIYHLYYRVLTGDFKY